MKANEFVKKFGWDRAKEIVNGAGDHHRYFIADGISATYSRYDDCFYSIEDLKRLVESYELINSLGGIEQAKSYAIDANACGAFNDENKIKQAILDVESCK